MTDVIMPQMGESIAEGTITKWIKNVGDTVKRDEPLFEISTDKVDAEIPAPASGVLREIRVQAGATVPVNTVVGVIGAEGEAAASPPAAKTAEAPAPVAAQPAEAAAASPAAPAAPPSVTPPPPAAEPQAEGTPGPPPGAPPAAESESPETVRLSPEMLAAARQAPPLSPPAAQPPAAARTLPFEEPAPAKAQPEMSPEELRQTRSSPVVRKIAAEYGVDIREVPGTGIGGRVTKQDILGHLEARPEGGPAHATPPWPPTAATAAPSPVPPPSPRPAPSAPPGAAPATATGWAGQRVQVVPMSPIRRKTAEHMVASKRTSAHVSTVWEIDMTRVDQLRRKYRQAYEERNGIKLTYLPFIIKTTIDALKAFPILNASVDGDNIVYHHEINLGMAVALEWGLIVPVIRNADEKNILGLARAVNDLAERARAKRLKVDEVQGGTFTITNPGVFGSLFGTPIINQPQVAILGVGTIEKRTAVRDDAIAIRTMAYFALTFDHRIVDGSDADRFMAQLKKSLQEFDESAL